MSRTLDIDHEGIALSDRQLDALRECAWVFVGHQEHCFHLNVLCQMLLDGEVKADDRLPGFRVIDFAFASICSEMLAKVQPDNSYRAFQLLLLNSRTIRSTDSFQWIVNSLPEQYRPDALQIVQSTLDERQDLLDSFFIYYHTFLQRTFIVPGIIALVHSYTHLNESNPPVILL